MRFLHIDKSAKECPIAPIILSSFYISGRLSKPLLPKSPLGIFKTANHRPYRGMV